MVIKTKLKESYEQIADTYFEKQFSNPELVPYAEFFTAVLPDGAKILDVGCGPGQFAKLFADNNKNVVGIDMSHNLLRLAAKNVPNAIFQTADFTATPFMNESFDAIWSCRALVHVPNEEAVACLKEWARVLKPYGKMCIIVTEGEGEGFEKEPYDPTGQLDLFYSYYQEAELKKDLYEAGFKVSSFKKMFRHFDKLKGTGFLIANCEKV